MKDEPEIELDAWEPQAPPGDFAEQVLSRLRLEDANADADADANANANADPRSRARLWGRAGGVVGLFALAASLMVRVSAVPEARGQAIAKERIEVSIGSRARAVLEPGAEVSWQGDDVVQTHGDAFYRVEPGARFRVHTPAGDVEVKGTCFAVKVRSEGAGDMPSAGSSDMEKRDMKSAAVGAALSAFAFVAVYEGKVAVSHASEHVDLGAGESAQVGAGGVQRSGALGTGEKSFDAKVAESALSEEPLAKANESLVSQVGEYRHRLEAITAQKAELEQTLKNTEQKLAAQDAAAPKSKKAEFDLGPDEWKDLAKDGTMKYMMPCSKPASTVASQEQLQKLALSPQDAPALAGAYARSNERLWSAVKPLCAQALAGAKALGGDEIAEKVGLNTCIHIVFDQTHVSGKDEANEAMRQVAEIRAGLRAPTASKEANSPLGRMFMALTGEMKLFESDLAQSLGPEEAHRVAYADGLCAGTHVFGGPGPREPEKK